MKYLWKRNAITLMTAFLIGIMPVTYASAASDDTEESQENAADEIDVEDDTEEDIETDDDDEDAAANLKTQIITIKGSNFVVDQLDGVKALYRTGRNDGSDSTYSCAAYIKRYYKQEVGVTVNNLFKGRTPNSSKGSFRSVTKPQVGDIVACSSTSGSNHWAIVKKINSNKTVTLIEQNWKWSQGGQTLCKVNRTISIPSGKYYRLQK